MHIITYLIQVLFVINTVKQYTAPTFFNGNFSLYNKHYTYNDSLDFIV